MPRWLTKAGEAAIQQEIIMDEAMALPAGVRAAAEAIEASLMFRSNFTPAHPLGRLHPAAVEFARLALSAGTGRQEA